MSLADYLAKNYLSSDNKGSKKRKRKEAAAAESVTIEEDGAADWTKLNDNASDEDDGPTIDSNNSLSSGLNKPSQSKSKWIKIGSEAPNNADQAAADAILVDAQKESQARAQHDDEAPAVVDAEDGAVDYDGPVMASGAMAGLQTAEQVTAALKRKERAERKAMQAAGLDPTGKAQETIYRDASGRIINVAMKRAEIRAKAEEEERAKIEAAENAKGDVQKRQKEERRKELQDAKLMGVARFADDEKLNEEMKGQERWGDVMAGMIKSSKTDVAGGKVGLKGRGGGRTYQGAFEPNRYGIRPGWRWDGVDRGNGFERKWFAARNKAKDRRDLEYAWQMDE